MAAVSSEVLTEPATNGVAPEENGALQKEKTVNGPPKKPRQKKPNYHEIHAKPLPLDVYPLPVFIPHNPISIIKIAFTILSHTFSPPNSHVTSYKACFSPETQSINVTDPATIRALWEQGFWGKGSLSRSEPQWLAAEKRRRGVEVSKTSAEVTQSRRDERKQFKLERAKAQREAIEQQLRQEGKLEADGSVEELVEEGQVSESPRGTLYTPDAGEVITVSGDSIVFEIDRSLNNLAPKWGAENPIDDEEEEELRDMEHLQLTPEEAFFLTYVLGVLDVNEKEEKPYPAWYLMRLYCAFASTPVSADSLTSLRNAYQQWNTSKGVPAELSTIPRIAPDNQFLLQYVVYHHFRSLGWVVRPGIKFAVDYLLYLRGPAFSHAEFAVMIIPSYSHPSWSGRADKQQDKDWWWLHRVNRVQTQVMKTLLLVYVEVPPSLEAENDLKLDIGSMLKKYSVREFVFKRWSPSRNRD